MTAYAYNKYLIFQFDFKWKWKEERKCLKIWKEKKISSSAEEEEKMLIDLIDFELKFNSSFVEKNVWVCMCYECNIEAGVVILPEILRLSWSVLRLCEKTEVRFRILE